METKFNFNSAICTSIEQSRKLLELGLKKETADCYLFEYDKEKYKVIAESWQDLIADEKYYSQYKDVCFPAWSLHRLLNLIQQSLNISKGITIPLPYDVPFDDCIERIEHLIKEGYFNKEYLENGND